MKEAIQKSIEGGFRDFTKNEIEVNGIWWEVIVMRPSFWQALGKAMGWGNYCKTCSEEIGNGVSFYCPDCNANVTVRVGWAYHWHRFIDHLASSGTPDDFFNELLTH